MAVFAAAFVYVWPAATALIDDHFMHVVWGRQVLAGRFPLRDMVALGMPLQSALSAVAEWAVGYRLLSEALIVSTAFAIGAVMTFVLASRASASVWIGILAAALQVAAAPRTYSYPKIIVYAAGIVLLWRYIDRPSRRRAALLGVAIATAFYLRHDHGLYLGVVAASVVLLRHSRELLAGVRQLALLGTVCVAGVAPFLVYVQRNEGISDYVADLRALAAREHQQNRLDAWPTWPLLTVDDVVRWTPTEALGVEIGVRWSPQASHDQRRAAGRRYGLHVPPGGPVESGRFQLANVDTPNVMALVRDPAIEDTAGLDRKTGIVHVPGLRIGRLHLLSGLDDAEGSAALLFYVFLAAVATTVIALNPWRQVVGPLGEWERVKVAAVVLVAAVTTVGFIRAPLEIRVGDALVAPLVLVAWLAGRLFWRSAIRGHRSRLVVATAVAAVMLLVIGRSVSVIGAVSSRFRIEGGLSAVNRQLFTSPPFDAWPAGGSAKYRVVRYVRSCTAATEPLLVLWFAPELYYYADRPFAGRQGYYMEGYWTAEDQQRRNLAALERDRPALAIVEAGREKTDLYTYPLVLAYLNEHYQKIGELPTNDGQIIRVLARKDRSAATVDAELGWPCYR